MPEAGKRCVSLDSEKFPPQSCKAKFYQSGSCSCNYPRSTAPAEQSWCQWEDRGKQDLPFLRWQVDKFLLAFPSCEKPGTSSDLSGPWESLRKGNKPSASEPFSERHQCPPGENTRSRLRATIPLAGLLFQFCWYLFFFCFLKTDKTRPPPCPTKPPHEPKHQNPLCTALRAAKIKLGLNSSFSPPKTFLCSSAPQQIQSS